MRNHPLRITALSLALLAVSAPVVPVFAAEPPTRNPAAVAGTMTDAPVERAVADAAKIDERKLQIAKDLTDWLNTTLQNRKALVAIVAREGGEETKKHDKTGMGHAGLAVYDPRAQSWIVYNLLNDASGKEPTASIWRSGPIDFFYGQKGYQKNALLMIPDAETQRRMYEAILNGSYKRLFFTRNYNLLSAPATATSLNCNKWLLMNIAAARMDNYSPYSVLRTIDTGFEAGEISLNPIERQFAKTKKTIRANEVPTLGAIRTVTVESLYRSDLFAEKFFYGTNPLL